jgi:integrase
MDAIALKDRTEVGPISSPTVRKYRAASMSRSTKRAIDKSWRAFESWARPRGLATLPSSPETLESYLIDLAETGRKVATIEQARYAINARHKLAGLAAPGDSHLVKTALAGIRRSLGTRPRQSAALTVDHVRTIPFREDAKGCRDRALLMIAVCGGFRRSELTSLRVQDVKESDHGVRLFLERSKGDQEASGVWVDIVRSVSPKHCPVEALREWVRTLNRGDGPLFPSLRKGGKIGTKAMSDYAVNLLVKWAAQQCGLDPAEFSGHSPRAGCATFLLDRGVSLNVVANHLRHKSINTTRRYDRNATAKALSGVY